MPARDLSILIPARNEMFLARTIEDILANIEADTEVITVLDGKWADPAIPQHERVNVIYVPESIGQRAATNLACRLSKAKYVMKCDAHCSFDKGFDRKMLDSFKETGDNVTMVPIMRNLWAFDWKCYHCGWKKYQGPTPEKCEQCGKTDRLKRKMVWIGKRNPQSTSFCFDSTPHFQYFEDWKHRPQYEADKKERGLTETMSLQGSCWMLTRDKYWELGICDENFGSWGSQGIEVALKTWLSGGRVLVNHNTWYAHMFRTQGGDFGFPYPISNKDQEKAKQYARDLFFNDKWPQQIHPLSWLVQKFWPVKGWTDEDLIALKTNNFEFKNQSMPVNTAEIEPEATYSSFTQTEQLSFDQRPTDTSKPEVSINATYLNGLSSSEKNKRGRPKKVFGEVTIIGESFLAKSVFELFPDAYFYGNKGDKSKANSGKVAFICVPTPIMENGFLDIDLVEEAVAWCQCPLIVLRSTVNPGTTEYLSKKYNKRILVHPEYVGDSDPKNTPFILIGASPEDRKELIELYSRTYNSNIRIRQVTAYEAEIIKLSENRAIHFKIAQCQELYDVCEKAGIDYYTVRDAVYGDDPRFSLDWTFVQKDNGTVSNDIKNVYAWCAWAESLGYNPMITKNMFRSDNNPDK